MSKKIVTAAFIFAVLLMVVLLSLYVMTFGTVISDSQSVWGAFGDYFGGILNPIFGALAFVGVLWSLHLQLGQLNHMTESRQDDELLQVVKDIDSRISECLGTQVGFVSGVGGLEPVYIRHMLAEAERSPALLGTSDAYMNFLSSARAEGSIMESPVREMKHLLISLHEVLSEHTSSHNRRYQGLVRYYIQKASRLVVMMRHVKNTPETTLVFLEQALT